MTCVSVLNFSYLHHDVSFEHFYSYFSSLVTLSFFPHLALYHLNIPSNKNMLIV